jgi:hypothetical protein
VLFRSQPFYNHTEIRAVEDKREVAVRALNTAKFESDVAKYCGGKKNCIALAKGTSVFAFDGEIERKAILGFIDTHVPREL